MKLAINKWYKYSAIFLTCVVVSMFIWKKLEHPNDAIVNAIKKINTYEEVYHIPEIKSQKQLNNFIAEKWIDPKFLDPKDRAEIEQILKSEVKIRNTDIDIIVSKKIGNYLLRKMNPYRAKPEPLVFDSYLDIWKGITDGKIKVACFEFSMMYALFANVAGVPTRIVHLKNFKSFGRVEQHTVAESYNRNFKKWFVVDLLFNEIFIKGVESRILNAYEHHSLMSGNENLKQATIQTKHGLKVFSAKDDNDEYFNAISRYHGEGTKIYYSLNSGKILEL